MTWTEEIPVNVPVTTDFHFMITEYQFVLLDKCDVLYTEIREGEIATVWGREIV